MSVQAKPRTRARGRRTDSRDIGILSRKRSLYTTGRLVAAAKARGHHPLVLDTLACSLGLEKDRATIYYEGKPVPPLDVVIPRIGASITAYGLSVVNQLDMMGVPVLNNSIPIARSRDKLRALQLLARFGVDIPRTVMTHDRAEVPEALKRIGGLPAILKLIQGTQGVA